MYPNDASACYVGEQWYVAETVQGIGLRLLASRILGNLPAFSLCRETELTGMQEQEDFVRGLAPLAEEGALLW